MDKVFERFVFNLSAGYRREELEGRPHLVVPAAILAAEVINGSQGPIYYPKEENEKDPTVWNGMPLVVYHPEMNGSFISARDPDVYNNRKVGVILRTVHDDKLRTECWFDEGRTREVDERVYDAITNQRPMEVSTGLSMELDRTPGELNGVKYTAIAHNYKPDHLAVLPDKVGAYSVAMGGGLFANEAPLLKKERSQKELDLLPVRVFGDPQHRRYPIQNQEDVSAAASLLHHAADPSAVKQRIIQIVRNAKDLKLPETWIAANELSFSDISCQLYDLLSKTYGEKGQEWRGWVVDTYSDYCIYYVNGKNFKVAYTLKDSTVSLNGTPVEVVRTTDYQPVSNSLGGVTEVDTMAFDKKAHIDKLISNGQFVEADRKSLEGTPDPILEKIAITEKTPAPAVIPATNAAPAVVPAVIPATETKAKLTLNDLPPELQRQVTRGLKAEQQVKDRLIEVITGNSNNKFTKEYLGTLEPEILEGMAQLSGGAPSAADSRFIDGHVPFGGMFGAGGGPPIATNAADLDPPLEVPEPEWKTR